MFVWLAYVNMLYVTATTSQVKLLAQKLVGVLKQLLVVPVLLSVFSVHGRLSDVHMSDNVGFDQSHVYLCHLSSLVHRAELISLTSMTEFNQDPCMMQGFCSKLFLRQALWLAG